MVVNFRPRIMMPLGRGPLVTGATPHVARGHMLIDRPIRLGRRLVALLELQRARSQIGIRHYRLTRFMLSTSGSCSTGWVG
jgi:hypothetical protein